MGIFLFSLKMYSQNYRFQHPKTPEVYQLDKFGNPDISIYTGRPNITIPLFNVENGEISLPFNIYYNSNGVRGDEESSQIGLGWNFENPILTQIVNGADDLNVPIVRTNYYHDYKARYLVYPQPLHYYENGYWMSNPLSNQRLNPSNPLISDPAQHLYEGFIGKLNSEGAIMSSMTTTYLPINNQLKPHHFIYDGLSPLHMIDFDMEVDFFRASFFGHNIVFYKIPNQNQFFVLNKKGYKVILNNSNGPIYSWEITTPDGLKFTFSNQKISGSSNNMQQYPYDAPYLNPSLSHKLPTYNIGYVVQPPNSLTWTLLNRTWNVTNIQDKNSNSVGIEYLLLQTIGTSNEFLSGKCDFLNTFFTSQNAPLQNVDLYTGVPTYLKIENIVESNQVETNIGNYIKCNKSISNLNYENSIIKRIFYNNTEVIFNSSLKQDNPYDGRIDSIIIKSSNYPIKTIQFDYSYYPENHILSKRLKLNSIINGVQKYSFEYNNNNFQQKTTDYWGNFNGLASSTPFTNPFRFYEQKSDIPVWASNLFQMTLDSENKSAHPENSKVGILEKIFYPTGGYTKYEYELNTFDNYFFPNYDNKITINKNNFNIQHLNIDTNLTGRSTPSFVSSAGDIISGTINMTHGISGTCPYTNSSFKIVKIPQDWIAQYNSGPTGRENFWYVVDQGYVQAETVYLKTNFTNLDAFNFSININTDAVLAARVKYSPQCPTTGSPIGQINAIFSTTKYNDYAQTFSSGNGLRVKSTSDYDFNNQLISQKRYNYFGGKQIHPLAKINEQYSYEENSVLNEYQGMTPVLRRLQEVSHKISSSNTSLLQTNVLGNGDYVGYDKVEITEIGSNNDIKGKTTYTFSNVPDLKPSLVFGITDEISEEEMNFFGRGIRKSDLDNGSILTKKIYDKNSKLIKFLKNEFSTPLNFDPSTCYNIAVRNVEVEGATFDLNFRRFYRTNLYYYPLKGSETLLKKSTVIDYFQNDSIKTVTNFEYDIDYNLPTQKITNFSNGDVTQENTGYTYNINRFKNKNILTKISGKSVYKNGIPQPWIGIKFDDINHFNPTSETIYEVNSPNVNPPAEITYDFYDNKGNLLQYTTKKGIPVAIIWGYNNTQPIAKIEGAAYADVQQLISTIVAASNTDASQGTTISEDALIVALDTFRKAVESLPRSNYQVTTYTYDPLIGVRSITPPSGIREVYIYDSANRLEKIVDVNGKLLKEFKYNYKN